MQILSSIYAWLSAPVHFLIWWPIFTGLASLGYTALDSTSFGHKALSTLASLGLDLPKLLAIVKSFFGGGGSPDTTTKTQVPQMPSKGTSVLRYGMAFVLGCALLAPAAVMISGCLGAKGAADTGALVTCVLAQVNSGQDNFEDIASACGADAVSEVVDIISAILLAEQGDGGVTSALHDKLAKVHHKAAAAK